VCRPPVLVDGTCTYVDLELDPFSDGAGLVLIDDQDEFEERCDQGVISAAEAAAAISATREVEQRLRACHEPFGALAWEYMAAALDLGLPPLQ